MCGFSWKDGVSFPAIGRDNHVIMATFCCHRCYLEALPMEKVWRDQNERHLPLCA
jgi:hypothetical protein